MFVSLFKKECSQTFKSLTFLLLMGCMLAFYFTQMGSINFNQKPEKSQQESFYGFKKSDVPEDIMRGTLGILASEYMGGTYSTYPFGFLKSVRLNEEKNEKIGKILGNLTGLDREEIYNKIIEFEETQQKSNTDGSYTAFGGTMQVDVLSDVTYDEFLENMKVVCDIVGAGSSYEASKLTNNTSIPKTYEDAAEEYDMLVEKDHFTGGYARIFCDYMGIVLAFAPVFLAATRILRDKRSQMQDLIYVHKASSAAIVFSRYLSLIAAFMLPILILSCIPLLECISFTKGSGITLDYLAFVKYSLGWLLPSVMIVTALGMLLTELTESALGILVQGVWWILDVFGSKSGMSDGSYQMHLALRHNTHLGYDVFRENFSTLVINRIFYAVLALILVGITVYIYELKRKGKLKRHVKVLRNRKSSAQA